MNCESLILHLQRMVSRRFGPEANTETGAATLSIARDRVSLTDGGNRVISETADGCAKALGGEGETVTLDALAMELVRWYAGKYQRDVSDLVSGILFGELDHLRQQQEGNGCRDDTADHLEEYVTEAISRRKALE